MAYRWPGNIRELRNVIERCVLLAEGAIHSRHLPPELLEQTRGAGEVSEGVPETSTLAQVERRLIARTLRSCNWNKAEAARKLGITWEQLRTRVKRYRLAPQDPGGSSMMGDLTL
jgi:DNA-binding NtrC family response regulator